MTFLAAMSLSGAIVLHGFSSQWKSSTDATLTVQIHPLILKLADRGDDRVTHVIDFFRSLPEQKSWICLRETTYGLLEPWLESLEAFQQLPIPQLVDITLSQDNPCWRQNAKNALAIITSPGATIDDRRVWLSKLIDAMKTLNFCVGCVGDDGHLRRQPRYSRNTCRSCGPLQLREGVFASP